MPEQWEAYAKVLCRLKAKDGRMLLCGIRYDRKKRQRIDPYAIMAEDMEELFVARERFAKKELLQSLHFTADKFSEIPMQALGAEEAWLDQWLLS